MSESDSAERKERSAYELAQGLVHLVEEARSGIKLTVKYTMRKFSVKRATASRYLDFVQRQAGLDSRIRGGRRVIEKHGEAEAEFVRAAALTVSVVTLSAMSDTRFHRELRRLASAARGELDEIAQATVDRLFGSMFVKRRETERPARYAETVDALSNAIRHSRRCKIRYTKLDGATGDYLIEPWALTVLGEALFVVGRKLPETVTRSFEIAAIQHCDVTNDEFEAPPRYENDLGKIFAHTIGTYESSGKDPEDVVLRVRGRARVLLQRRRLHVTQRMDAADADGWSTATLRVWICPELVSTILSMLPDVVVVSPNALREGVRSAVRSVNGSEWDP